MDPEVAIRPLYVRNNKMGIFVVVYNDKLLMPLGIWAM